MTARDLPDNSTEPELSPQSVPAATKYRSDADGRALWIVMRDHVRNGMHYRDLIRLLGEFTIRGPANHDDAKPLPPDQHYTLDDLDTGDYLIWYEFKHSGAVELKLSNGVVADHVPDNYVMYPDRMVYVDDQFIEYGRSPEGDDPWRKLAADITAAIEYDLTAADLDAFVVHHAAHAPHLRRHNQRMRWVYALVFGLIAVGYAQFATTGAVIFAVIAVIYLIFYARFNRWWVVRHSRRANAGPDGPTLGPTQLRLTDDQLLVDEPEGNARLAVTAIRRFDESDTHHFIYLGPSAALIVPKAADGAADFMQALRDSVAAQTPPSSVDHPQT